MVQDFKLKPDGSKQLNNVPYFLTFDSLVVNFENVMHLNFRDRLKRAHDYILPNFSIYRVYMDQNPEFLNDKRLQ